MTGSSPVRPHYVTTPLKSHDLQGSLQGGFAVQHAHSHRVIQCHGDVDLVDMMIVRVSPHWQSSVCRSDHQLSAEGKGLTRHQLQRPPVQQCNSVEIPNHRNSVVDSGRTVSAGVSFARSHIFVTCKAIWTTYRQVCYLKAPIGQSSRMALPTAEISEHCMNEALNSLVS